MTIDELVELAESHAARGEHREARALYVSVLRTPGLDAPTRARLSIGLAAKERLAGDLDVAEERVREVLESLGESPRLVAMARFELGTCLVTRFSRAPTPSAAPLLRQGLEELSRAAELFEAEGRPERLACLLGMADALGPSDFDTAVALHQRVFIASKDGADRWMRFVHYRAARGMASDLLIHGHRDEARAWLDRALEILVGAAPDDDPERRRHLGDLAELFESYFGDFDVANAVRRRAEQNLD
ncbi:MAG: hypothetical protein U0271_31660 [Polyangiaceae bacterium]